MDLGAHLDALAAANRHGAGFLAAYGVTWLVSAAGWAHLDERRAALVTLFQGVLGLPLGFALTALVPGPPRPPGGAAVDALAVIAASGQLTGLPVVVFLVVTGRYTLVPLGMVTLLVVHLGPYAWLYRTPLYLVLAGLVAVTAVVLMHRAENAARDGPGRGATHVCASTGALLVTGSLAALLL